MHRDSDPSEPTSTRPNPATTGDDGLAKLLESGRTKSRFRNVAVAIITLGLLAAGGYAYYTWKTVKEDDQVPRYVTEAVKRGDLVSTISSTATVEALNAVEVGAEISGRILSLNADFNDPVTEGQVLAKIDPEQHQAAVAQAKAQMLASRANVAEAEATLDESRKDADRAKELAAKGLTSSKELESAVARAVRAEASLNSAQASAALSKAALDAAKSRLAKTEIVCPINGTVLSRQVEVGQTINAGMQTPVLFIIAEDLRRMRLSSLVDEADIGKVREGQTAAFTVDAYPPKRFSSAVTAVRNIPQTDQNVVSYEVLLSVDNSDMLLKPGMTASVEIVTDKLANVLLIPNKALRFSPPRQERGFRGPPMPFLGRRAEKKPSVDGQTFPKETAKLDGNQALLWLNDASTGPGALRPVKVNKLATDGVQTAVESDRIKEGDEVVVELSQEASQ